MIPFDDSCFSCKAIYSHFLCSQWSQVSFTVDGSEKINMVFKLPEWKSKRGACYRIRWEGESKTIHCNGIDTWRREERVVWFKLSPIEQCVKCVMQGLAGFVWISSHVRMVDSFKRRFLTVFGSIQAEEKSATKKENWEVWGSSAGWIFWVFSDKGKPYPSRSIRGSVSSVSPASLTFILYAFLLMSLV